MERPTISPKVDCVDLPAPGPQRCNCKLLLVVRNNCGSPLLAEGFSFDGCDATSPCKVNPGETSELFRELHEVGTTEHVFPIEVEGQKATITAITRVKSFADDGCALRRGSVQGTGQSAWWMFAVGFAAWLRSLPKGRA